ncbi:GLPGLI family protein [Chitinophaga costaii]|nr:GLPGLI family protein [Chitinophaga costaii]
MHKFVKFLICATVALPFGQWAKAQVSGVIDYEVTMEVERRGGPGGGGFGGGGQGGGEEGAPPQVMNFTQHFTFNASMGKVDVERPNFGRGGNFQPPFTNTTYVNVVNKKVLQAVTEREGDKKTYYTEDNFVTPISVDTSSTKTKKIAGYNCKKAIVKQRNENYTVWYTTELGINYSPVNGLLPGNGVVLSAESDKRSFVATKVSLKPVEDSTIALPAGAEKITDEEMREKRHTAMEKMREQFQQQQ